MDSGIEPADKPTRSNSRAQVTVSSQKLNSVRLAGTISIESLTAQVPSSDAALIPSEAA